MAGGRPSLYKPEYCQQLIDHMAKGGSFWSFAADVDVCFDTLSEWCKVHPEFSEAKSVGMAKLLKFDEHLNLAGSSGQLTRISKVETIVDPEGNTRKIEHKEAATFAQTYRIFTMKNRYPKLYRDKIELETTVDDTKKTSKVIEEVMNNPELRDAALAIAEMLSDEET